MNRQFNRNKPKYQKYDVKPFIPGIVVHVYNNDTFTAIRKFKKKVQEEGILQAVRKKQEYVKPSEKRRKAKAASKARVLKKSNS